MVSGGTRPPDATPTKYYKCHLQCKVGAVVCIMCGSFYHTNEIVSKYNSGFPVKFIDNALIIYQDHPNMALTSNLPYDALSSEANQLIAQIKLTTREQIKQVIISEMNLEKHNNKKDLKDTVFEDYSELESLKIENQLLKHINSGLQDKNRILNELLTKEKQGNNNNNIKTFAEITANPKPKIKRVPKIIKKN